MYSWMGGSEVTWGTWRLHGHLDFLYKVFFVALFRWWQLERKMKGRKRERDLCVCVCGCIHKPACLCSWQFYSSMKVDKWNIWEVARLWMHSWFKFLVADIILEKWAEAWGTVELVWPKQVHKIVFRSELGIIVELLMVGYVSLFWLLGWQQHRWRWFQYDDDETLSNVFFRYSWLWTEKLVLILQIQFHLSILLYDQWIKLMWNGLHWIWDPSVTHPLRPFSNKYIEGEHALGPISQLPVVCGPHCDSWWWNIQRWSPQSSPMSWLSICCSRSAKEIECCNNGVWRIQLLRVIVSYETVPRVSNIVILSHPLLSEHRKNNLESQERR